MRNGRHEDQKQEPIYMWELAGMWPLHYPQLQTFPGSQLAKGTYFLDHKQTERMPT